MFVQSFGDVLGPADIMPDSMVPGEEEGDGGDGGGGRGDLERLRALVLGVQHSPVGSIVEMASLRVVDAAGDTGLVDVSAMRETVTTCLVFATRTCEGSVASATLARGGAAERRREQEDAQGRIQTLLSGLHDMVDTGLPLGPLGQRGRDEGVHMLQQLASLYRNENVRGGVGEGEDAGAGRGRGGATSLFTERGGGGRMAGMAGMAGMSAGGARGGGTITDLRCLAVELEQIVRDKNGPLLTAGSLVGGREGREGSGEGAVVTVGSGAGGGAAGRKGSGGSGGSGGGGVDLAVSLPDHSAKALLGAAFNAASFLEPLVNLVSRAVFVASNVVVLRVALVDELDDLDGVYGGGRGDAMAEGEKETGTYEDAARSDGRNEDPSSSSSTYVVVTIDDNGPGIPMHIARGLSESPTTLMAELDAAAYRSNQDGDRGGGAYSPTLVRGGDDNNAGGNGVDGHGAGRPLALEASDIAQIEQYRFLSHASREVATVGGKVAFEPAMFRTGTRVSVRLPALRVEDIPRIPVVVTQRVAVGVVGDMGGGGGLDRKGLILRLSPLLPNAAFHSYGMGGGLVEEMGKGLKLGVVIVHYDCGGAHLPRGDQVARTILVKHPSVTVVGIHGGSGDGDVEGGDGEDGNGDGGGGIMSASSTANARFRAAGVACLNIFGESPRLDVGAIVRRVAASSWAGRVINASFFPRPAYWPVDDWETDRDKSLVELAALLETLQRLVADDGEAEDVRRTAHALKGVLQILLGDDAELTVCLQQIEAMAIRARDAAATGDGVGVGRSGFGHVVASRAVWAQTVASWDYFCCS